MGTPSPCAFLCSKSLSLNPFLQLHHFYSVCGVVLQI
uniref:Uncharacterized protein n=1 Tax=Anguilla anguilla TaxID=7936 RepID=A0A0E9RRL2_ANGAN